MDTIRLLAAIRRASVADRERTWASTSFSRRSNWEQVVVMDLEEVM